MNWVPLRPLQGGMPEFVPDLIGVAGAVVLVLLLVALAGFAYRATTGGIEWPEDSDQDDDALQVGDDEDEWDYY